MIITSVKNSSKYFWVKIPRTATTSYERLFFPDLTSEDVVEHLHIPFYNKQNHIICPAPQKFVHGFSVVRHPVQRFISLIRHLNRSRLKIPSLQDKKSLVNICQYCGEVTRTSLDDSEVLKKYITNVNSSRSFVNFLENEDVFYDFLYSTFYKNCELKNGLNLQEVFQTENHRLINAVFVTQVYMAYHPKVKIFRYENLPDFNSWIETTLGYNTSYLQNLNQTRGTHEVNIDVTTNKFKELVKYLFEDDFKLFGY